MFAHMWVVCLPKVLWQQFAVVGAKGHACNCCLHMLNAICKFFRIIVTMPPFYIEL